jgi:cell wall-associated NlpC family hydrolase
VFADNHSRQYVTAVMAQAARYTDPTVAAPLACGSGSSHSQTAADTADAAVIAVMFACAQLGKPYVWGGTGDAGFDCSGLTHAAYAAAGIDLPRTAQTQYDTGPLLPAGAPLEPGDLLFFGTPSRIHHVGISLGGTLMIDAPDVGQTGEDRRPPHLPRLRRREQAYRHVTSPEHQAGHAETAATLR